MQTGAGAAVKRSRLLANGGGGPSKGIRGGAKKASAFLQQ